MPTYDLNPDFYLLEQEGEQSCYKIPREQEDLLIPFKQAHQGGSSLNHSGFRDFSVNSLISKSYTVKIAS